MWLSYQVGAAAYAFNSPMAGLRHLALPPGWPDGVLQWRKIPPFQSSLIYHCPLGGLCHNGAGLPALL